jgi:hypothetical protein
MVRPTLVSADEASQRRAVHDGPAALLAHLLQFKLHAAPHATQVDCHHAVVVVAGRVSRLGKNVLDAGIVVCGIQATESGNGLGRVRTLRLLPTQPCFQM